jgi:hypothetical protein
MLRGGSGCRAIGFAASARQRGLFGGQGAQGVGATLIDGARILVADCMR